MEHAPSQGQSAAPGVYDMHVVGNSEALLLEEYRHLADSLTRNEDRGERRAEWFLLFAAAMVALLVAVRPSMRVAAFVPATVLLLGLITRARIIHRNVTADEYIEKIRRIETFFVDRDPTISKSLPFPPPGELGVRRRRLRSIWTGGALQTVEFVNALAAGAFVSMLPAVIFESESVSIFAVLLGAVAFFAVEFAERMFRTSREP